VHAKFGPTWRRNLWVAERNDVRVDVGNAGDLATFHHLYRITALREGFVPRPVEYFHRILQAGDGARLYLARQGGEVRAAAVAVGVAGGPFRCVYGASSHGTRHVEPSTALHWRMLRDAHACGAEAYDLGAIGTSLDREDALFPLTRFKLGSGGHAVEHVGEWDLPLNRPLYRVASGYRGGRWASAGAAGTVERVR
jgi:lipid II:glycine glycyltransferase (peptidoglycan interpeptide bridge formation enzyme)